MVEFNKLTDLCKPVIDFIKQNYDQYTEIVITDDFIKVKNTSIGIPVQTKTTKD